MKEIETERERGGRGEIAKGDGLRKVTAAKIALSSRVTSAGSILRLDPRNEPSGPQR